MADLRRFETDELLVRPGMYFNPQTEVLVIVDDSPDIDHAVFNMEDAEGADWVLISDDAPVDEAQRDEIFERFQVRYHPGSANSITEEAVEDTDELEEDDQEVGRE
jgi:hypothetical protein